MPFREPGVDWLLPGPDVQLRHTRYDLVRAADHIRSSTYPQAEGFAARNVLQLPSEKEILAAFTRAELRISHCPFVCSVSSAQKGLAWPTRVNSAQNDDLACASVRKYFS
jgi:hypothetical protein